RAYTSGEIEGDDEVAVGQSADEDARSYSWPLVNVRHVLGLGVEARVINEQAAEILLRELRTVYYAHRSLTAVTAYGRNCGANEFVSWLKNRLANDEHFGNLKRADALLALETALQFDGTPGEPKAGLEWQTRCFRQWANAFAEEIVDGTTLATRHRVAYQQIFDPDFKVVWWKHLREAGVSSGLPHLLACVAYRSEVDLTNWETTALLLSRETPADRQAVAQHGALNEDAVHSNPGFFPEAIKDDVSRQLLTKIWRLSEDGLENEAWARGFQGARDAVETMKLFTLGHMCERKAVQ
ncbi:TfuA-like protein, partial [Streptomyces sp. NPDC087850]|uniref:TfuA-like protein n=1 Tax=Streptomyces sp. NPDC087850 TaxID=3365809 RepID=UPI0037F81A1A